MFKYILMAYVFVQQICAPCIAIALDDGVFRTTTFQCREAETKKSDGVIVIGKIAVGILKIIKIRAGNWYYCGKKLNANESSEKALEISYLVVNGMKRYGMDGISPWGVVGTIYNESGMDACAIGPNPRRWGYANGMLKPNKMSISHAYGTILNFVRDAIVKRRYSKTGFDLGYCQILSKFYPGQEAQLLDKVEGLDICLLEMSRRSKEHKTKKPWLYWKVSRGAQWYANKIRGWAKIMGATKGELNKI